MKPTDFQLVIDDIEANVEGEPYSIVVCLRNGGVASGPWQRLAKDLSVVVISPSDAPPLYVDVSEICAVSLQG